MTTVREKPIPFSSPMIKAILRDENPKTQTRRIMKPQPPGDYACSANGNQYICMADGSAIGWQYYPDGSFVQDACGPAEKWRRCPYGVVGMHLWVKETWAYVVCGEEGLDDCRGTLPQKPSPFALVWHRAGHTLENEPRRDRGFRWRPPRYMPRWASRIMLEITGVRVERLTKISSEDAVAEGFAGYGDFLDAFYQINKHRITYSDDPWVWVIAFQRIS